MALQFEYKFPSFVETLLKAQEQPATVANGVLSVDCFVKSSSISVQSTYVKALCYLVLPLVVAIVCRVAFCKARCMQRSDEEVDRHFTPSRSQLAQLSRMETVPQNSKAAGKNNHACNFRTRIQ